MLKEEFQIVLNAIRKIVHDIRLSSSASEKNMGLSTAQIFVLHRLAQHESMSILELSQATFTNESSLEVVVSKLIDRRLIEYVYTSGFSSPAKMKITSQGSYLLDKCPSSVQQRLMLGFSKMTEEQQRSLAEGLKVLMEKSNMSDEVTPMLLEDLATLEEEL
ncbi:MAG: MarR family transcriptional regulator [Pseudobdellovibrio sp.]|jgi:DNA-binding MarR family transcriptional regulator|nr:MarR family transcriptional regulator [Pseudobdellovibrio sp.]